MLQPRSILRRIIVLHLLAISVTALVLPATLYFLLQSATSALHERSMQQLAESLVYFVTPSRDATAGAPQWTFALPETLNDLYSEDYGRYWYAIRDETGKELFSSAKLSSVVLQARKSDGVALLSGRKGNVNLSGVDIAAERFGKKIFIEVAEDLTHRDVIIDDIVKEFFPRVGWIILPLLIILLLIDVLIFRRALRPLTVASEQARSITPQQTEIRLDAKDIPTELLPLVIAVNNALDRLEAGYKVQRDFSADAAHELRTPLAILRTKIEVMKDKSEAGSLLAAVENMSHVVTQLLHMAEADLFALSPEDKADLHDVATRVIEMLAPLAIDQQRDIGLIGDDAPVWVKGNSTLIFRAIRNLVENALRFAPVNSTVDISVIPSGMIAVADKGPGISDEEKAFVFHRFWRRDRQSSGNTGLGLSIVSRIADLHDASLTIEDVQPHGAKIKIQFQLADGSGRHESSIVE